jgi:NTP pyrophosphatase (non-canonical NTP hydrolase)
MTNLLKDYNEFTKTTAIYPTALAYDESEAMYLALGLADEAGEVAGKIKKLFRDGHLDPEALTKELGDVLWYLTRLSDWNGVTLEEIMLKNTEKLRDRKERGVLGGSGDER